MKMNKPNHTLTCWINRAILCLMALSATGTANATEELYFYHTDHLGTPQAMTDSQGQVVWQAHYQPFGEVELAVEGVESHLRFAGQYFDQETGNYYNYFRDYDPGTGRYLQSDPIGLDGGISTYAYVSGNPLSRIDPLGLKDGCPTGMAPDSNGICQNTSVHDDPCISVNCATGIDAEPIIDTRSPAQSDCDECLFVCNLTTLFVPAPLPNTVMNSIKFGGVGVAGPFSCSEIVCKDECGKSYDCEEYEEIYDIQP
jgi:RHS repeat-associated protein